MKLKTIQNIFHRELEAIYNKEEINQFFFIAIAFYYKLTRLNLAMEPEYTIDSDSQLLNVLEQLKLQRPIQYILGETSFYGLPFKVNKATLIPRPETEELVDWIIQEQQNQTRSELTILDIGTGSGCIAVTLAKYLPKAKVYAVDVSERALQVAKANAKLNNVTVNYLKVDILNTESWGAIFRDLKCDIIVSNPPYVREQEKTLMKPNVLENEPHLALFIEDDNPLQFYKAITNFANSALNKNGKLFFEINEYLGNKMIKLLLAEQFEQVELRQDIFKKDRMIKGLKANG